MGLLAGRDPLAAAAPAPMEPRVVACEQGSCVAVELPGAIAALLAARDAGDLSRSRALTVRTEAAAAAEPQGPPLFGSTGLEGRRLLFRPRLPLLPGDSYRATFRPAALLRLAGADDQGTEPVEIRFRAPGEIPGAPEVIAVHPARESVPANLLRAYVHFSTPMRPDLAPRFVRLEDDTGAQVPLAFVEVPGGLWDPDHTRLTLLFHPGRIKRGVAPRRALGPPLVEGRRYRLRILPGWPSATGQPLAVEVGREWRVGPADRAPIAVASWRALPPRSGSREPLRLEFDEPLDHALAERLLRVERDGLPVAGEASVEAGGTVWLFRPRAPWRPGDHAIRVAPALEDLAGNRASGLFDRPPGEGPAALPGADRLLFRIPPG